MSAQPVDVLAVMEDVAALIDNDLTETGDGRSLREARAAVAELIAAVADVYGARCDSPCESPCPSCRIQFAVARCTGEGA